jgi:hypothetical protein
MILSAQIFDKFAMSAFFFLLFQNAVRNSSLELAALEQQKADEDVLKLAEDQKVGLFFCVL